jgi:hypothetical protein
MSEVDKATLIDLAAAADHSILRVELRRDSSPFTARA